MSDRSATEPGAVGGAASDTTGEANMAGVEASAPGADEHQATTAPTRLLSLDAARGLAIVVMLLTLNPGDSQHRLDQLVHPSWHGLAFVDLFFPLFLFAMGASMTLSRRGLDARNVLRRTVLLLLLGILLATFRYERLFMTGVLQHIAGSYFLAYLVLLTPRRRQLAVTVGLVGAVWLAYVWWAWGGDPWAQGDNLALEVDTWAFGGYRTDGILQTVMSTATVVGGAFAGRLLQQVKDRRALARQLLLRGGWLLGVTLLILPFVPVNKRLWTPSFTTVTLATSFVLLAAAVWLVDVRGITRPAAPLVHVGVNPIVVYMLFMTALALLDKYGEDLTPSIAPAGYPTLGFLTYAVGWTVLWWFVAYVLYRRKIFIRI